MKNWSFYHDCEDVMLTVTQLQKSKLIGFQADDPHSVPSWTRPGHSGLNAVLDGRIIRSNSLQRIVSSMSSCSEICGIFLFAVLLTVGSNSS
jgi:hypothetical protein